MVDPREHELTVLFEQHRLRLERIVAGRTRDRDLAADVVSEAFARLHRVLLEERMPDDPPAWLCRVACNLAVSAGRRRQVETRFSTRVAPPRAPDAPDDVAIGRERLRRVATAMAGMPAQDRQLVLAAAAGASASRLAERSGGTAEAARVRLCRARRRLREAVGELA